MNKYELTVVLNVKLEDEERAAALEKVKGYITRFGGTAVSYTHLTCFLGILLNAADRSQDLPDPAVDDQIRLGIPGGGVQ